MFKVETVRSWPTPLSVKIYVILLAYVLTAVGSYQGSRTLLSHSSSVLRSRLLEAESAFQMLKQTLTEPPIQYLVVDTDASLSGFGAVLSQLQNS